MYDKKTSIGSWMLTYSPNIAEIMCKYFDWIVIDLQHSTISLNEMENLIRIINLHNKKAYVRIDSINPVTISKVLDCGAKGIIAPDKYYSTNWATKLEEIYPVHDYSYYTPKGKRSIGLYQCNEFGDTFIEKYKENQQENIDIILQIETTSTLANLDNILKKTWVTGTMIGTFDITANMGLPWELSNPTITDKIKDYIKTCNKHNKPPGIHLVSGDNKDLKQCIQDGYRFIAFGFDMLFINEKIKQEMNQYGEI